MNKIYANSDIACVLYVKLTSMEKIFVIKISV